MKAKELKTADGGCTYCTPAKDIEHPLKRDSGTGKKVLIALLSGVFGTAGIWAMFALADYARASDSGFVAAAGLLLMLLTVGCILASVMSAMYLAAQWIEVNLIGRTYFHFTDEDGLEHTHKDNPTLPTSPWFAWWKEHNATIPVFQMRYGGWFRKSRIIGGPPKGRNWYISTWDGAYRMRLKPHGSSYAGQEIVISDLNHVRTIVEEFYHPQDLLNAVGIWGRELKKVTAERDHYANEACGLKTMRDQLGCAIIDALDQIAELRETRGRSEHARAIRKLLQAYLEGKSGLKVCASEAMIELWRGLVKQVGSFKTAKAQ